MRRAVWQGPRPARPSTGARLPPSTHLGSAYEKLLPWPADGPWPTAEQYLYWFQQQTREDQVELMAKFIRNAHEWKALGRTL